MRNANRKPIQIDLDRFKLHLNLKEGCEFSLHFDTPSRRFYLCVIALVVNEMKKLGRMTSIPLGEHWEVLALLNETVAAGVGSSSRDSLLSRIYRKWKDGLPDLENAPLFKVLGRRKEYGDGGGKAYLFTDEGKDAWANLFEYKGSFENVRLRFSVDRLGATLDDVEITYGEFTGLSDGVWERLVSDLRRVKDKEPQEIVPVVPIEVDTSEPKKPSDEGKWWAQWRFVMTGMIIVAILAGLTLWVHFGRNTETASKEKTAFPLPEYPSIAVLPFANLNGDPKQDYLSDGITNEIISGLSKVPRLFVIASNSSFSYKGKPVMVQQAAKDLGVKYILEGSVQTNDGRIRIMAQLINGLSGAHLWAERYDRDLTDLFDLQDEIMMKVVESLQVLLTDGERARIYARGTKNFEAYTKFLKAREILRRYNKEDTLLSRKISEEVIALDPNYPSAYAALGENYRVEARWLKGEAKEQAQRKAIQLLEKANAMDPSQASAIGMLGYVYTEMKQYEKGMAEAEKAVAVNPNDTDAVGTLGVVLTYNGRFKDALKAFEKASRLNPLPPMWYHYWTACANLGAGRYEESISQFMKLEEFRRKKDHTSVQLVAAYILSGREEEARKEAEDILNENPKFSLEQVFMGFPFFTYKDQKYVGFLKAAALKAGLP